MGPRRSYTQWKMGCSSVNSVQVRPGNQAGNDRQAPAGADVCYLCISGQVFYQQQRLEHVPRGKLIRRARRHQMEALVPPNE